MGAYMNIRRPKGLDVEDLKKQCAAVPIDVEMHGSWLHFHYAYWGHPHEINCERFVANFARKHHLKLGKWSY